MRRILLALAIMGIFAASASAATTVWWEMESSNCGATASLSGGLLHIEKPLVAPEGYYEFTLVMKMSNDAAASTQGLTGYRTNLWNGLDASMSVSDPLGTAPLGDEATIGLLNPLSWTGTKGGAINTGQKLLSAYGRNRASGQPTLYSGNGPLNFIRFDLRIDPGTETFGQMHYLYQTVGVGLFATLPPTANQVIFGPNPSVTGATYQDTWAVAGATLPVIEIQAIPEPGTLALLGLGLLGLIRRR